MPIPHQCPGPSSLSASIRPRNTKFLRLNLNQFRARARCTSTWSGQGLVQSQIGKRRVQYPKEFKLGVISYWRDVRTKGVSKYAVVKRLQISEKMLRDRVAKEPEILSQRSGQRKGTAASLEDYSSPNINGKKLCWISLFQKLVCSL